MTTNTAPKLSEAFDIDVAIGFPAREKLRLQLKTENGQITSASLTGVGCRATLELIKQWRPKLSGALAEVPLPEGSDHSALMLRELILKAQGLWRFPYDEDEMCHCRAVPTRVVDAAIVGGCHTLPSIRAATGASTSCGACGVDIQKVIAYRLQAKPAQ